MPVFSDESNRPEVGSVQVDEPGAILETGATALRVVVLSTGTG